MCTCLPSTSDTNISSTSTSTSTKAEERKRNLRDKNKVAAAKCRQRQRKQAESIRAKSARLSETNAQLKSYVQELRGELNGLRSLALGNGVFLLLMAGMFSMFYFASIYVQNVLGYSALTAGLAFLPVTAGIMIGATAAITGTKS